MEMTYNLIVFSELNITFDKNPKNFDATAFQSIS